MITHVWSVFCEKSITDRDSNNISLVNVIEQLSIPGMPQPEGILPFTSEVVSFWMRSDPKIPVQCHQRVSLVDPAGNILITSEIGVELARNERVRTRTIFQGFPLPLAGRYLFQVDYQLEDESVWHNVARIPLTVIFQPELPPRP